MSELTPTTIDLLRHGRTTADDILRGRIDVPLSEQGYQQMLDRVAPYLSDGFPWQQLVTSPLQRCARFTRELGEQHGAAVAVDEGFLEMDFGDWDGHSLQDLHRNNPQAFGRVWREPDRYSPPNGESFPEFVQRIGAAWDRLIERHQGQHILLVCHGGVIRALLTLVMQTPLTSLGRIDVPYACLSRVRVQHSHREPHLPQLIFHNPH